jgi:hypothetical protein
MVENNNNGRVDAGLKNVEPRGDVHGDDLIDKLRHTLAEIQKMRAEEVKRGRVMWGINDDDG